MPVKPYLVRRARVRYAGGTFSDGIAAMPQSRLPLLGLLAALLALFALPARGELLLQQSVPADQAGVTKLAIDRARIVLVRVRQEKGPAQIVEVTLATEPVTTLTLRCVDPAAASQLLDALRGAGPPVLDVTARCRP